MSLLRRASAPETSSAPAVPPVPIDYDIGSIKRRWLRIRAAGIRAVGPSGPPEPQPMPEVRMADSAEAVAHHGVVAAELHAIDVYAKQLEARLERLPDGSYEGQEMRAERVQLRLLYAELERDLGRWPEGTPEQRRYIAIRSREIRAQTWTNAERLARAGEHREARRRRIDALRSRHLAEHEIGLRAHLSGY
jgi:hypothetical protein